MKSIDASKLKSHLETIRLSEFTLAALVGADEEEIARLLRGDLDEERAVELRVAIEMILGLEEGELIPPAPRDTRALKAVAAEVEKARRSLKKGVALCDRAGEAPFCTVMRTQLAGLDGLSESLDPGEKGTEPDNDADE